MPHLDQRRPPTLITNSASVIEGPTDAGGIDLIALGGSYSHLFDMPTLEALGNPHAVMALLPGPEVDGRIAFHQNQEVLEVDRRMIASAARSYLPVDHQEPGRTAPHVTTDLDGIVSFAGLQIRHAGFLADRGNELVRAGEDDR